MAVMAAAAAGAEVAAAATEVAASAMIALPSQLPGRQAMPDFKLPLSGDVVQAINPWSWVYKSVGGQFGLININLGQSANPALEQKILDEVGSYGRQLGRMGDVLQILLKRVKLNDLSAQERLELEDFQHQVAEIERLKARSRS